MQCNFYSKTFYTMSLWTAAHKTRRALALGLLHKMFKKNYVTL